MGMMTAPPPDQRLRYIGPGPFTGLPHSSVFDEVTQLVAAGDAELGVGTTQVRCDGTGDRNMRPAISPLARPAQPGQLSRAAFD
jgi:hypothetical protein